jgi:hypothetical protein
MPAETFDASAGAFATLDARARADEWDGLEHRRVKTVQYPDLYSLCACGTRIDAGSEEHLQALFEEHEHRELQQRVYRPAAQAGLAKARARLAEVADRRPEGDR